MNFSGKLIRESSTYLIANTINAAIPFLLLPFLTTHLTPYDYGILTMFQLLTTAVTPFIGLNVDATLSRYYFDLDQDKFKKLLSNGIVITIVSAGMITLLIVVLGRPISGIAGFPIEWLWSISAFSFFQKILEVLLALWRVQHRPMWYAYMRILRTTLDIALSVMLILVWRMDWEGRLFGQLAAVILVGAFSILYLIKLTQGYRSVDSTAIRTIWKFGSPLIPHELGAFALMFSDRLLLANMVGLEATGVYSVGYQIGLVIGLMQNSFNQAWVPWFYDKLTNGTRSDRLIIIKIIYGYCVVMFLMALGLYLAKPFLVMLVGTEFKDAGDFIFWIGLGFAFNGMYKMIVNYLFFAKRTRIIGALTTMTAVLNIGLSYFFIKGFGSIGAAYATAIAFFIQFFLTLIICIRVFKMPK